MPPEEGGTGGEDPTRDARLLAGALLAAIFPPGQGAAGRFGLVAAHGATRPRPIASVDAGAGARFDAGPVAAPGAARVGAPSSRRLAGGLLRGLAGDPWGPVYPFDEERLCLVAAPGAARVEGLERLLRALMSTMGMGGAASREVVIARRAAGFPAPASLPVAGGPESLLRRLLAALDTGSIAVWVERFMRILLAAPGSARCIGILAADGASASFHVFLGSRLVVILSASNGPSGIIIQIELESAQSHISGGTAFSPIMDTDDDDEKALICQLPIDILTVIFLLLQPRDAICLKLACKHFSYNTPKMMHQIKLPMLLLVDELCTRPFSLFSSELNMKFLLPYQFPRGEVKLLSTDENVVLLESNSQLLLLNLLNGCVKLLPQPLEPYSSFTMLAHAGSSFHVQIVGLSSPSPFNVRFGYSDGESWEEELLENNHPFQLSILSGPIMIEDELYCLGVDGSVGYYSREQWQIIPSHQEGLAFLYEANNSVSCILFGRSKAVALVLDLELGMWQRLESLGGFSVVTGTVQSFSVQGEATDTIKLAFLRGRPDVRTASTGKLGSNFILLVKEDDESCSTKNRSLLLELNYPNSSLRKADKYDALAESIWVKVRQVLVMSVV